jgi:hypothetical protein
VSSLKPWDKDYSLQPAFSTRALPQEKISFSSPTPFFYSIDEIENIMVLVYNLQVNNKLSGLSFSTSSASS